MWSAIAIVVVISWVASVWTGYTAGLPWGVVHGLLIVPIFIFVFGIHSWWMGRQLAKKVYPLKGQMPLLKKPAPPPKKEIGHEGLGRLN